MYSVFLTPCCTSPRLCSWTTETNQIVTPAPVTSSAVHLSQLVSNVSRILKHSSHWASVLLNALSKWHHANRCWPSIRHLRVTVSPAHYTHTHTHTHTSVTLYTPPTRSLLTHHWSHAAAAALSSVKIHADRRVRATRLNQQPVRRPQ